MYVVSPAPSPDAFSEILSNPPVIVRPRVCTSSAAPTGSDSLSNTASAIFKQLPNVSSQLSIHSAVRKNEDRVRSASIDHVEATRPQSETGYSLHRTPPDLTGHVNSAEWERSLWFIPPLSTACPKIPSGLH